MLRAAICGTGRWGSRLVESVQDSSMIRFTTALTRDPAKQQDFAAKHGVKLTSSYAELLTDKEIDAIVLATPHSQHHQQIVDAAKAGKHLFVEKPFTLTPDTAADAIKACQTAGITVGMGFNRRYAPSFVDMRKKIQAGEIGTVQHVEGQFSGPSGYQLKPGAWRANRTESPAGAMTARGVHVLDAMLHLAGTVERVFAYSDRRSISAEVDDTSSALLRFKSGVTGYIASLHATSAYWRLHVFGSKGSLEMRGDTELLAFDPDGKMSRQVFDATDKERAELEDFADAVAKGIKFVVSPAEIINNVAVMQAMVASAASGKPVEI
jgi:predicted dehydrogenase